MRGAALSGGAADRADARGARGRGVAMGGADVGGAAAGGTASLSLGEQADGPPLLHCPPHRLRATAGVGDGGGDIGRGIISELILAK